MLLEIGLTILLAAAYIGASTTIGRVLAAIGRRKEAAPKRALYITKIFNGLVGIVSLILLTLIWGVDYSSVFVLASSILAVLGVAFFAQWSILSNITASIVIFFSYPARIGDTIRVVDGENSLEGEIVDINLFQVLIRDPSGNIINYPNNLIIQKPLIRLGDVQQAPQQQALEEDTSG